MDKLPCVEKTPLTKEVLDGIRSRLTDIEHLNSSIKQRVSYIDGNEPPINSELKPRPSNCMYDELIIIQERLLAIVSNNEEINNRLINHLG